MTLKVKILQFSTTFMQVYTRPKRNLLGSSLAFTLKEGPVRCVKVCNKSWVILTYASDAKEALLPLRGWRASQQPKEVGEESYSYTPHC